MSPLSPPPPAGQGHVNKELLADGNLGIQIAPWGLSFGLEGGDQSWNWGLVGRDPEVLSPLPPALGSQGWAAPGDPAVS